MKSRYLVSSPLTVTTIVKEYSSWRPRDWDVAPLTKWPYTGYRWIYLIVATPTCSVGSSLSRTRSSLHVSICQTTRSFPSSSTQVSPVVSILHCITLYYIVYTTVGTKRVVRCPYHYFIRLWLVDDKHLRRRFMSKTVQKLMFRKRLQRKLTAKVQPLPKDGIRKNYVKEIHIILKS